MSSLPFVSLLRKILFTAPCPFQQSTLLNTTKRQSGQKTGEQRKLIRVPSSLSESRTAPAPTDDETPTASGNNSTHGGGPSPAETADTEFSDALSEYDDLLSDLAPGATPDNVSVKAHQPVTDSQVIDSASDAESIYNDDDNNSTPPPHRPC